MDFSTLDPEIVEAETEVQNFLAALIKAIKPDYVIETGSYHGSTSKIIGKALRGIGGLDTLEIDLHFAKIARQATEGLPVTVYCINSLEFKPKQPIDLLFLDSDVGNIRMTELMYFAEHMSNKGIVLLHDSTFLWKGFAPRGWQYIHLPTKLGLTMLQLNERK